MPVFMELNSLLYTLVYWERVIKSVALIYFHIRTWVIFRNETSMLISEAKSYQFPKICNPCLFMPAIIIKLKYNDSLDV